jgi:hypothetical protein
MEKMLKCNVRSVLVGACCAVVVMCRAEAVKILTLLSEEHIKTLMSSADYRKIETGTLSEKLFAPLSVTLPSVEVDFFNKEGLACKLKAIEESRQISILIAMFRYCDELRIDKLLLNTMKKMKGKSLGTQCMLLAKKYNAFGFDSMFVAISESIYLESEEGTTENLLWTFSHKYFGMEKISQFASVLKEKYSLRIDVNFFPYKISAPFIENGTAIVEGVEFPDCIETAVRHFFNLTQPLDLSSLYKYWNLYKTPLGDRVFVFFSETQGAQKANLGIPELRTAWAEIISKLPGLAYKRKTDDSLLSNNLELTAGWSNYLKTIAYIKNDHLVLEDLWAFDNDFKTVKKNYIEVICKCFARLAAVPSVSVKWISDASQGVRDMENGCIDLLGRIRCKFSDDIRPVDFVMQNGHGYVVWAKKW